MTNWSVGEARRTADMMDEKGQPVIAAAIRRAIGESTAPAPGVDSLRIDRNFTLGELMIAEEKWRIAITQEHRAHADVGRLRAALIQADAALDRPKPRAWARGDSEPVGVTCVHDVLPRHCTWNKGAGGMWVCNEHNVVSSWETVAARIVIEVIS